MTSQCPNPSRKRITTKPDVDNVVHFLEEAYWMLDMEDTYQYDDHLEMALAKKEAMRLIKNLSLRRQR
ncbi:hypothetical protein Hena1_00840 [Erwinia phage Hena1]|uniref:Uncharacterized protein n=1 Tax=Erwinia phage Hena1 TaxID=2678601 RepID=A0A6B9J5J5_9CAUD|nr:hypothetical protein HWC84_gp083 [Erwinia phage Hena1]QGZ16260.1 hypothetical protein Hena1_00840 [Erwinia phage Hena1]